MREDAHTDAKKAAAWKLAQAFLDGVRDEKTFTDREDRAMAVAMAVMRFMCREALDPEVYLSWLGVIAENSFIKPKTPEEAELFAEARRTTEWH
jgi:hypothetical protein